MLVVYPDHYSSQSWKVIGMLVCRSVSSEFTSILDSWKNEIITLWWWGPALRLGNQAGCDDSSNSKVQTQNVPSGTCLFYKPKTSFFSSLASCIGWRYQLPTQKSEVISESTVSFSLMYPVNQTPLPMVSGIHPLFPTPINLALVNMQIISPLILYKFPVIVSLFPGFQSRPLPMPKASSSLIMRFMENINMAIPLSSQTSFNRSQSSGLGYTSPEPLTPFFLVQFPMHRVYTEVCCPVLQRITSLLKQLICRRTWICTFSPRQITFHRCHGNDQT